MIKKPIYCVTKLILNYLRRIILGAWAVVAFNTNKNLLIYQLQFAIPIAFLSFTYPVTFVTNQSLKEKNLKQDKLFSHVTNPQKPP